MAYNKKKPVKKAGMRKMRPGGKTVGQSKKPAPGQNMIKGRSTTSTPMKNKQPVPLPTQVRKATELITRQMKMGGKPSAGAIKMAEGILRAAGKKRYGGKNVPMKRRGGKTKK